MPLFSACPHHLRNNNDVAGALCGEHLSAVLGERAHHLTPISLNPHFSSIPALSPPLCRQGQGRGGSRD